jgi:hypothetical protein
VQSNNLSECLDEEEQRAQDAKLKKQIELEEARLESNESEKEIKVTDSDKLPELEEGEHYKGADVRKNIICCVLRDKQYMCCEWWNRLSAIVYDIVEDDRFTLGITILIVVNSAILATQHYG